MEPITLTADTLDTGLVEYLSRAYLVTVWEENGKIIYELTKYQENGESV